MDTPHPSAQHGAARYVSLAATLGDAPPAVLDGLEVVEEQVLVLGPLDLDVAGPDGRTHRRPPRRGRR